MVCGEPVTLLDTLEEHHRLLDGVRIHQMDASAALAAVSPVSLDW